MFPLPAGVRVAAGGAADEPVARPAVEVLAAVALYFGTHAVDMAAYDGT